MCATSTASACQGLASQRGIALVLVLWVISPLAVLALGLTTTQRTETALTANQIADARCRAAADAVTQLMVLDLLSVPLETVPPEQIWLPDGLLRPMQFEDQQLEVTL